MVKFNLTAIFNISLNVQTRSELVVGDIVSRIRLAKDLDLGKEARETLPPGDR